ncbi:MAG: response regulator transcription factor [Anaerolineales bacterium]|nr:response regulator transcription factor [Anaerolineales bacterium]
MPSDTRLRILIVDDELAVRRFLRTSLQAHGYVVYEAHTGENALVEVINKRPDLIILDIGLPGINGVEVTRRVREWSKIPILILSVLDQEKDKITALDAGADDYLTKPFGVGELMARMRAAIRRSATPDHEPVFISGDLKIDFSKRIVFVNHNEVSLTPTEYDLLRFLAQNAGKVLTHQQIIQSLWGGKDQSELHLLRVNISNLRKKIEPDSTRAIYILTEPGVGYRLRIWDAEF